MKNLKLFTQSSVIIYLILMIKIYVCSDSSALCNNLIGSSIKHSAYQVFTIPSHKVDDFLDFYRIGKKKEDFFLSLLVSIQDHLDFGGDEIKVVRYRDWNDFTKDEYDIYQGSLLDRSYVYSVVKSLSYDGIHRFNVNSCVSGFLFPLVHHTQSINQDIKLLYVAFNEGYFSDISKNGTTFSKSKNCYNLDNANWLEIHSAKMIDCLKKRGIATKLNFNEEGRECLNELYKWGPKSIRGGYTKHADRPIDYTGRWLCYKINGQGTFAVLKDSFELVKQGYDLVSKLV